LLDQQDFAEPAHCAAQSKDKSHQSYDQMRDHVCVRTSKYLNNLIEQDHRRVKQGGNPMLGFKRFRNAAVTIGGIELAHKIKKGQFDISGLGVDKGKVPQAWEAVLAA
jgi:transposase-like protein